MCVGFEIFTTVSRSTSCQPGVRANHSLLKTSPLLAFITLLHALPHYSRQIRQCPGSVTLKQEVVTGVENRTKLVQEMVDSIFSFAEPARSFAPRSTLLTFLKTMVSRWSTVSPASPPPGRPPGEMANRSLLWVATSTPLLGPSQAPGVRHARPLAPGAPGHGEGHNSGMPAMVVAALAVKDERKPSTCPVR